MTRTGLDDVMASAFTKVNKMLLGKKFCMHMRSLRMVVKIILEPIISDLPELEHDAFTHNLEERPKQSKTRKLWLDYIIKPVFIMMAYVRAERESGQARLKSNDFNHVIIIDYNQRKKFLIKMKIQYS